MFLILLFTNATINFTLMIPLLILLQLLFKYINHISASIYHKLGTYIFCFLMAGIFLVTGIPSIKTINLDANISFNLFDGIVPYYDQYVNNILLFLPFGLLLPLLWAKYNFKKTVITGFLLSLTIETMQLFCFRISDVNDLWTNTLGTCLGYILFLSVNKLSPKIINKFCINTSFSKKKGKLIYHELYFYFFITWFVIFFIHPFISDSITKFIYNN
ncbi:VanZ family protein [Anaerocolumna sp. MB42-C2]|uniref:VanZ family protein n=1 Tax=Anaerocolumna sp. MB42-C2 TaxID=3070997 RepID=UPI0027DFDC9B|nr:VanZ family protein [Anaerocolumna sp. MB42-C2]WMJ89657.1 VanZ family protein [Anaerocolumna sp. MB42-C2]